MAPTPVLVWKFPERDGFGSTGGGGGLDMMEDEKGLLSCKKSLSLQSDYDQFSNKDTN